MSFCAPTDGFAGAATFTLDLEVTDCRPDWGIVQGGVSSEHARLGEPVHASTARDGHHGPTIPPRGASRKSSVIQEMRSSADSLRTGMVKTKQKANAAAAAAAVAAAAGGASSSEARSGGPQTLQTIGSVLGVNWAEGSTFKR